MKTMVLRLLLLCVAVGAASFAQTYPPFTNAQPWTQLSFSNTFTGITPAVGEQATCIAGPYSGQSIGIQVQLLSGLCGSQYTYGASMVGGNSLPSNYILYSYGQETVNAQLLQDYKYETNCSCACIIEDYSDGYGCP
jgi:hypothetical protein